MALKLSEQVAALTQIVSKLMAFQVQLKRENLELRGLIMQPPPLKDRELVTSVIPFACDLFQPSPIKLFSSSSPDFDFEQSDDLAMSSYFSSPTVFDPRSVFRSDTSPMMGYQELIPDLPLVVGSPLVTSPKAQQSTAQALTVKRKITRKASGPLNILIVEDDPLCQQLISRIIKSLHIGQCEVVADGVEAVINMSTNSFDLILMDMQLPHLDGLQATQNIRKFNRRTPIVSMTARLGEDDIKKYFEGGIDEVLPKPFDKQSVKRIIQQFYKLSIDED